MKMDGRKEEAAQSPFEWRPLIGPLFKNLKNGILACMEARIKNVKKVHVRQMTGELEKSSRKPPTSHGTYRYAFQEGGY